MNETLAVETAGVFSSLKNDIDTGKGHTLYRYFFIKKIDNPLSNRLSKKFSFTLNGGEVPDLFIHS